MATFNRLFIIMGFALCSLTAASESCSVATGECDALDQSEVEQLSLLQKSLEHKVNAAPKHHKAVSDLGHKRKDVKRNKVHVKLTRRNVTWLGTCHGDGCPPAYSAGEPCPSECEAYPGTTGSCVGTSEHNKTCPNTFDLSKDKSCPKGCTAIPDTTGDVDLDFVMKSSHKRKVHAKVTRQHAAWLGTCHGEGCPPAYNATHPCPSECEAYAGTTGDCLGTSEHNKTCPNTFDLSTGKFCPKGCTVVPDANGEDLDFIMKSSHKRKVHAKKP